MYIAAAIDVNQRLIPAVQALHDAIAAKAARWDDIVKIGRTHMQDATPITLGQEWSGYAGMLADDLERIEDALEGRLSPGAGRHGGRHRHQRRAGICRGGGRRYRQADRPAVRQRAQQVRGAGRA